MGCSPLVQTLKFLSKYYVTLPMDGSITRSISLCRSYVILTVIYMQMSKMSGSNKLALKFLPIKFVEFGS